MMKKNLLGFFLLAGLIGLGSVPSAYAYFTTNANAGGSYGIELGNDTDIEEEVDGLDKHIVVTNHEDSQPVFVRVKLFFGNEYITDWSIAGDGWSLGEDDFYYFADPVDPGQSTSELLAQFKVEDESDKTHFNVVVVSESAPVIYDENNRPVADWSQAAESE
ncbi:hypothetical protein [uncultured Dubosiella sp.]|jgi:hypothetical protein|uniref:hypothetical protein n=1 Tax=uncultured Dubosiella sp. TaxID=1937011 RepID=UPI00207F0184|nr:hypothetical protein [uncultured Dubosiella sp.]GJM56549.1 hypothetical protein EROP_02420 [Erysipelotrichaceae bacterium OPF54]GJM59416.1 hypothetical protein EROP_31090 [Erysipelotrichaceae bacterium OPF54]